MDNEKVVELSVPLGHLASLEFQILTDDDMVRKSWQLYVLFTVEDGILVCCKLIF